ncbi:MAG: hypothetical protein KME29_23180 [Calothrix sp. FI2-JRJ7]|nr:hypothetical protein [Calothrix sp. FI2-JRJ7]
MCFVCERPTKLSFDDQNRLHADGEPAIEYADGFKVYSYHGTTLPEKYGEVLAKQWKAHWLLEEEFVYVPQHDISPYFSRLHDMYY